VRNTAAGWLVAALALWAPFVFSAESFDRSGGPFVPTPPAVVEAMLKLAGVGPKDFVVDLGSGDGRIVLAAARAHKARGVGVEIDQELVDQANAEARKQGLAERARFVRQDVREADLGRATVLTLYLLPGMMQNLRTKLLRELQPGARVVSHDFTFDQWKPDRSIKVETQEKYEITGQWTSDVHLWIVPAPIEGAWRVKFAGAPADEVRLELKQAFQHFSGSLVRNGRVLRVRDGQITGSRLAFAVRGEDGRAEHHSASVTREQMTGEIRDGDRVIARWSAARVQ
jgi:SAM-dependent methyltransferase